MEPIEILKKLKSLKADPGYTKRSRMTILKDADREETGFHLGFKKIIVSVFHSGWSIALTAALFLMAISSFSILKVLSPATTAIADLAGIRAEAQDVDMQIQIVNVAYNPSVQLENKTSTQSIAVTQGGILKASSDEIKKEAEQIGLDISKIPTEPVGIDSLLEALSE